jgi:hypothetical protein
MNKSLNTSTKTLKNWQHCSLTFTLKDCGGGGDCLFHCLAKGYEVVSNGHRWTMQQVRDMIVNAITQETFHDLLYFPEEERKRKEVSIESITRAKQLIGKPGIVYQGTSNTLHFINKHAGNAVGYMVLSNHGPDFIEIVGNMEETEVYIILFNYNSVHWLLGNLDYEGNQYCAVTSDVAKNILKEFIT